MPLLLDEPRGDAHDDGVRRVADIHLSEIERRLGGVRAALDAGDHVELDAALQQLEIGAAAMRLLLRAVERAGWRFQPRNPIT